MIDCRKIAIDSVEAYLWDALKLCHTWCDGEDYTYDFSHIIQLAKLILEEENRIRAENEI